MVLYMVLFEKTNYIYIYKCIIYLFVNWERERETSKLHTQTPTENKTQKRS